MEDSKGVKNIYQRVNAVMEKVSYIQREKKQGMQYSITSHDAVTALLRPHLVEQGIVYHPVTLEVNQDGNRTEILMSVRFVNIDDPTDFFDVPSVGYGIDPQDKGPGKGISYGVKYALLKTFGLETGDDPDNDQNVKHEPGERRSVSTPAPKPSPSPRVPEGERKFKVGKIAVVNGKQVILTDRKERLINETTYELEAEKEYTGLFNEYGNLVEIISE